MRAKVQLHYSEPDGTGGVMNYFSSDNPPDSEAVREALLKKAHRFAGEWALIYPDTKFTVVEAP